MQFTTKVVVEIFVVIHIFNCNVKCAIATNIVVAVAITIAVVIEDILEVDIR